MKTKKTTGSAEVSMLYNIRTVFTMMKKTFPKSRLLLPPLYALPDWRTLYDRVYPLPCNPRNH